MAVLFNSRNEKFAQQIVQGYSQTEAYTRAGYSANGASANAARLIAIDSVRMRVEELQSCTAMLANTNAATMLFELEAARIAAMNSHSYLAAVKAIDSKMKLLAINKKANLEEK